MKTFKQLSENKEISARLYNAIYRGIYINLGYKPYNFRAYFNKLTPEDILDAYSIKQIMGWRNLGLVSFKELLNLIEPTIDNCNNAVFSMHDGIYLCRKTGKRCDYAYPNIGICDSEKMEYKHVNFTEYLEEVCGLKLDDEQRDLIRTLENHKNNKIIYSKSTGSFKFI